jgi:hypothetical protein
MFAARPNHASITTVGRRLPPWAKRDDRVESMHVHMVLCADATRRRAPVQVPPMPPSAASIPRNLAGNPPHQNLSQPVQRVADIAFNLLQCLYTRDG